MGSASPSPFFGYNREDGITGHSRDSSEKGEGVNGFWVKKSLFTTGGLDNL